MNIKKFLVGAAAGALMLSTMALPALAVKPNGPSAVNGLEHPGQVSQLYLYEKDTSWNAVEGGAWGKMTFSEDSFVFNGHGLELDTGYTLVKYAGTSWPTAVCLANGTSNNSGNLNLADAMDSYGDKVWLVLSSDVDCNAGALTDWNPSEYLFEYNTI